MVFRLQFVFPITYFLNNFSDPFWVLFDKKNCPRNCFLPRKFLTQTPFYTNYLQFDCVHLICVLSFYNLLQSLWFFRISASLSQPNYSRLVKIFFKIFRLFSSLMEEVCHFASPMLTLSISL